MPIRWEGTWLYFVVNNRPIDSGDVSVIIKSNGMRGYDVYLDEVYIGKETSGDGSFGFSVKGKMYHNIRVFDGRFNYPKRIYFLSGLSKIINVEPGTAV